jgi:hypothetical protein
MTNDLQPTSVETKEVNITEQILTDCAAVLQVNEVSEDHITYILNLLEKSIAEENLIEHIADEMISENERYGTKYDETSISNLVRGLTFEAFAISNLPEADRQYKEFENFLLWSLKDPRIWLMDWFDVDKLTKEEKKLLATYERVKPDSDELNSLRNNDAISIRVKTDPESNKRIAVITGVVEAKLHAVKHGTRDEKQMRTAPEILHDTIRRYRLVYPLVVKGLDLTSNEFPDEIDIVDIQELTYEIVHPQNARERYRKNGGVPHAFKNCEFTYLPINVEDINAISSVLTSYVAEMLPSEVKK